MAKVIRCQCGFLARGESPDELADAFEAHLRADHPGVAGQVRREDVLAMVEEA
jgi:predicted small metal-binding protein